MHLLHDGTGLATLGSIGPTLFNWSGFFKIVAAVASLIVAILSY